MFKVYTCFHIHVFRKDRVGARQGYVDKSESASKLPSATQDWSGSRISKVDTKLRDLRVLMNKDEVSPFLTI